MQDYEKTIDPKKVTPSVSDKKTIEQIIEWGKDFANSERYELALEQYKQAMKLSENLDNLSDTIEIKDIITNLKGQILFKKQK